MWLAVNGRQDDTTTSPSAESTLERSLTVAAVSVSALAAVVVSVGLACRRRRANRKLALLSRAGLAASMTTLPGTLEAPEDVCANMTTVSKSDLLPTKRSEYEATTTTTISITCSMTSRQQWQESVSTKIRSKKSHREGGAQSYGPNEDPSKKKKSKQVNAAKAYLHEERPATEGLDACSSATSHERVPPEDTFTNSSMLDMNLKCPNKKPPHGSKPSTEKLQLPTKNRNLLDEFETDSNVHLTTPQSDKSSSIAPNQDNDFITNDEFEYDDFIPEVAGSYFAMDTPGYMLTWSQRQNWTKCINHFLNCTCFSAVWNFLLNDKQIPNISLHKDLVSRPQKHSDLLINYKKQVFLISHKVKMK